MEALAEDGWSATAIDLRGHGSAPRASSYTIADYAGDLAATTPEGASTWDLVIGHSIGGAAAVEAAHAKPSWTHKLLLLDPALKVGKKKRAALLETQRRSHLHDTVHDVAKANPLWSQQDCELKVAASKAASLTALERTVLDNDPWDVSETARALTVHTRVLGGEEELGSMFAGDYIWDILGANGNFSYVCIQGSGHSVHRDKPAETIEAIRSFANV